MVTRSKKMHNSGRVKMRLKDFMLEEKTKIKCMECGKEFKKKIGAKTMEVKCPKCGSYDTEPA